MAGPYPGRTYHLVSGWGGSQCATVACSRFPRRQTNQDGYRHHAGVLCPYRTRARDRRQQDRLQPGEKPGPSFALPPGRRRASAASARTCHSRRAKIGPEERTKGKRLHIERMAKDRFSSCSRRARRRMPRGGIAVHKILLDKAFCLGVRGAGPRLKAFCGNGDWRGQR